MAWGPGNMPGGPLAGDVVADRPSKFFEAMAAPPPVDRAQYDFILAQRDKFEAELADARAELDNTMTAHRALGATVALLTSHAASWQDDRDEHRERADEYRDRYERAESHCTELEALVADLRGKFAAAANARDTASAAASL